MNATPETEAARRAGSGRLEDESQRLDRNLQELLQELRVALPGVQVLFAFLLVVPFSARFSEISEFQQVVYFVTLLLSTGAAGFLIAPTVHHRIQFRQQQKERIVMTANRFAIVGLTLLAAAMTGAVMLITDLLYKSTTVAVVAAVVALMFALLWYAIPLRRAAQRRREISKR